MPISETEFQALVDRVSADLGFTDPQRDRKGLTAKEVLAFVNTVKAELERRGTTPGQLANLLEWLLKAVLVRPSAEISDPDTVARAIAEAFGYSMELNRSGGKERFIFRKREAH